MLKRHFLQMTLALAVALASPLVIPGIAHATDEPAKKVDYLFVQNSTSFTYENGKLTLKGISPATVFFSDRPERIAGHMATTKFVPFWKEGKDSFLSDPPNASLSILGEDKATEVVVELRDPVLKGDELSYDVHVLQGELPAQGGVTSLFIDVIGMPRTPYSYAGAARRAYRY